MEMREFLGWDSGPNIQKEAENQRLLPNISLFQKWKTFRYWDIIK